MGGEGHKQYMRMLNLGQKSRDATGFQGNVSPYDDISRAWK